MYSYASGRTDYVPEKVYENQVKRLCSSSGSINDKRKMVVRTLLKTSLYACKRSCRRTGHSWTLCCSALEQHHSSRCVGQRILLVSAAARPLNSSLTKS